VTLRDIDRLVAEKVMGWTLFNYEESRRAEPEEWGDAQGNDGWSWDGQDNGDEAWEWKPTTDPVAAKVVRERLALKWHWILAFGRTRPDEPPYGFGLQVDGGDFEQPAFIAEASTEELAVAICALQTVGIKIEEKEIE
jgi:hypothetical protein